MISWSDVEVSRVEESVLPCPAAALNAAALVRAHLPWLAPDFLDAAGETFWLVFQSWIVRFGGKTIVVDPCNGNGRVRPTLPYFTHQQTPYIERFKATGISPEQVDLVFCTHLHCDHCGWNTMFRDGSWRPTFPNARYVFLRREVERWDPGRPGYLPVAFNEGVFEQSVAPIIAAGLAELVADRHRIMAGLEVAPAGGHTLGHAILNLHSRDGDICFTGDAFHHPLQIIDPRLDLGGADDLAMAIETRRQLRDTLAERQALMVPAHFPSPHGGYVSRHGTEHGFTALPRPAV